MWMQMFEKKKHTKMLLRFLLGQGRGRGGGGDNLKLAMTKGRRAGLRLKARCLTATQ
jgi:hypothetical protein